MGFWVGVGAACARSCWNQKRVSFWKNFEELPVLVYVFISCLIIIFLRARLFSSMISQSPNLLPCLFCGNFLCTDNWCICLYNFLFHYCLPCVWCVTELSSVSTKEANSVGVSESENSFIPKASIYAKRMNLRILWTEPLSGIFISDSNAYLNYFSLSFEC